MARYENTFHDVTVTLRFPKAVSFQEATRQARDGMMYWRYYCTSMDGISEFSVSAVGPARLTSRRKPGKKTASILESLIADLEPRAGEIMMYCENIVRFVGIASDEMDVYYIADEIDRKGKVRRTWLTAVAAITPLKDLIDAHSYAYHASRMASLGSAVVPFLLQECDGFNVRTVRGKAPVAEQGQQRLIEAFSKAYEELRGPADQVLTSEFHRACASIPDRADQQKLLDKLWPSPASVLSSAEAGLREMDDRLCALARERDAVDAIRLSGTQAEIRLALRQCGMKESLIGYEKGCDNKREYDASGQWPVIELTQCLTGIWFALDHDTAIAFNQHEEDEAHDALAGLIARKMPNAPVFLRIWLALHPGMREAAVAQGKQGGLNARLWPAQAMIYANYQDVRDTPSLIGLTDSEAETIKAALTDAAVPMKN